MLKLSGGFFCPVQKQLSENVFIDERRPVLLCDGKLCLRALQELFNLTIVEMMHGTFRQRAHTGRTLCPAPSVKTGGACTEAQWLFCIHSPVLKCSYYPAGHNNTGSHCCPGSCLRAIIRND